MPICRGCEQEKEFNPDRSIICLNCQARANLNNPTTFNKLLSKQLIKKLKEKFGEDYVVNHHSDFDYNLERMANDLQNAKLDREVWYDKSQELEQQIQTNQDRIQELENEVSTHLEALKRG